MGSANQPVVIDLETVYDDSPAALNAVFEEAFQALFGTSNQGSKPGDLGPQYQDLVQEVGRWGLSRGAAARERTLPPSEVRQYRK